MSKKNRERDPNIIEHNEGPTLAEAAEIAAKMQAEQPHPQGTDTELGAHPERPRDIEPAFARAPVTPYPTGQTEIKTMVNRQETRTIQQIYRCVYDEQALAKKLMVGEREPDVFCPVCGNRMVKER